MSPRLFIAIDLPENIRTQVRTLLKSPIQGAKYSPLEQMHLTLKFLGEVPTDSFPILKNSLASIIVPSFSLCLKGTGCFPNPSRARVLWLGVASAPALHDLQKRIESCVTRLGINTDTKPFIPHLTLARFKQKPGDRLEPFLKNTQDFISDSWSPETFHLFSSQLSSSGAVHRVEQSYRIG